MNAIDPVQQNVSSDQEAKMETSDMDMGEDDALRKVEATNTPDQSVQSGVRHVEAVTLTWTKTSLASAFVWYVGPSVSTIDYDEPLHLEKIKFPFIKYRTASTDSTSACGSHT